jgi:DNA-binding IclR family transcriptional regulator
MITVESIVTRRSRRRYRAPALDRGLDILELLSASGHAMSQSRIAAELGLSSSDVFRMLSCLVDRGYVTRSRADDGYVLTFRLHQLAQAWPLLRNLREAALPEMHRLAKLCGQSCHLGVQDSGRLRVVAQAEAPAAAGVTVKLMADYSLLDTASGRVLLAWQPGKVVDHWLAAGGERMSFQKRRAIDARLAVIRKRGYELTRSDLVQGFTGISFPILDPRGEALACLTVPYLPPVRGRRRMESVIPVTRRSASAIASLLNGGTETNGRVTARRRSRTRPSSS